MIGSSAYERFFEMTDTKNTKELHCLECDSNNVTTGKETHGYHLSTGEEVTLAALVDTCGDCGAQYVSEESDDDLQKDYEEARSKIEADRKNNSSSLDKVLDKMPDDQEFEFFDNESFVGICINWAEKGRGFGEYTFFTDKKTGILNLDTERDSIQTVEAMICKAIDKNPESVKQMFRDMIKQAKHVL